MRPDAVRCISDSAHITAEAVALLDCGTLIYQWIGRSVAEPSPGQMQCSTAEQLLTAEVEHLVAQRPCPIPEVSRWLWAGCVV